LDRINGIYKILILYFQFPEETENTQSPSAKVNKLICVSVIMWHYKKISEKMVFTKNFNFPLKAD